MYRVRHPPCKEAGERGFWVWVVVRIVRQEDWLITNDLELFDASHPVGRGNTDVFTTATNEEGAFR